MKKRWVIVLILIIVLSVLVGIFLFEDEDPEEGVSNESFKAVEVPEGALEENPVYVTPGDSTGILMRWWDRLHTPRFT